jgi:hypothetical protein
MLATAARDRPGSPLTMASDAVTQIEASPTADDRHGAEDVLFGETKTYSITVSNPGTATRRTWC